MNLTHTKIPSRLPGFKKPGPEKGFVVVPGGRARSYVVVPIRPLRRRWGNNGFPIGMECVAGAMNRQ
jgi:hypothetical protein